MQWRILDPFIVKCLYFTIYPEKNDLTELRLRFIKIAQIIV